MTTAPSGFPTPLTPSDCDLRGLPFMPIDTVRLLDSDFFAIATPEEFRAGFVLWCKSWQQVPAGSLPDDDRVLAHLSGAGVRWRKVKEVVLRNWVTCSDGRLYHPVVCEKALEALPARLAFRDNKTAETERKQRERDDRKAMFSQLRAAGIVLPYDTKTRDLRARIAELPAVTSHDESVTGGVTGHGQVTAKTGRGTGTVVTEASASGAGAPPKGVPDAAEAHLWSTGKSFLGKCGVKAPGSVIGKWKGEYGTAAVIEALGVAQVEPGLVDAVPFITKVLQRRSGQDGGFSIGGVRMSSPC